MNFEDDKQKNKRLSQLLSSVDKNCVSPDKEFLDKLQEKSTAEFMASTENQINSSHTKTSIPIWRFPLWSKAGYIAAAVLIISSWLVCFVVYREVIDLRDELARRDIAATPIDDSVTINFYLKEHQDFIAQQASLNSAAGQSMQMLIDYDDILYYEFFNNQPEFSRPGIIVRRPSTQQEIGSSESPAISNGHTLTLSEAREAADFDLISPSWLHPGYKLGQIRTIEGRDALQLIYNNSINSISLFEQPLDGQRGLSHHDFREYAVYNNQEEGGGIILAWRDNTLSYILIGNIEISQLMDMAQSISAVK